jgi:3-oxoacyl-[acyl-carrier-protein] synthase II
MNERRVVVTAVAAINAAGGDARRAHEAIARGDVFLRSLPRLAAANAPVCVGGEVRGEGAAEDAASERDRAAHLVLGATEQALRESRLDLSRGGDRIGVAFGHDAVPEDGARLPLALQELAAQRFDVGGFAQSVGCDRASGAAAMYVAWRAIRAGDADVMIAGGSEAPLTPLGLACHFASGELSIGREPMAAYRPFDRARAGLALGEGAAVLVLEEEAHARARGATIVGELIAASMTTDPGAASGDAWVRAMRDVLARGRLDPSRIDLVLAEGAASREGDLLEARALGSVFGEDGPLVSCTKGAYGHLLGASGATEAVIALLSMQTGRVPPIAGLARPDPSMRARFVREPTARALSTALVNARSRRGVNVSLLFGRAA